MVGSTKSNTCDRRREAEDDDERDEAETAARLELRRLWLAVNGWHRDIRKVAWMAMPRKIAEGRAIIGLGGWSTLGSSIARVEALWAGCVGA